MLTLLEIGTVFALAGGTVFYLLLRLLSNRERVANNRELQRRIEEQAAQIQTLETRLRYVETALCYRNGHPAGGGAIAVGLLDPLRAGAADLQEPFPPPPRQT